MVAGLAQFELTLPLPSKAAEFIEPWYGVELALKDCWPYATCADPLVMAEFPLAVFGGCELEKIIAARLFSSASNDSSPRDGDCDECEIDGAKWECECDTLEMEREYDSDGEDGEISGCDGKLGVDKGLAVNEAKLVFE